MSKIKQKDEVVVIAGKDKGKKGTVLKIIKNKTTSDRVVVEGINMVKKHVKSTQEKPGGIVDKEAAMDISNVAIFNPTTGKADKVGYKVLDDGKKVRVFKSNGEVCDE